VSDYDTVFSLRLILTPFDKFRMWYKLVLFDIGIIIIIIFIIIFIFIYPRLICYGGSFFFTL